MRAFRIVLLRLRSLVRGRRVETELDDELRFHLERQIDAHVAAGLSPEAARTQAHRDVGAIERWKEECRDRRGWRMFQALSRDVRHTWRSIRARPGASLAIVIVLGLGLGLTAAMFALADPFVLRPLPYRNPGELVVIGLGRGVGTALTRNTELPTVERLRERRDLFQAVTTFRLTDTRLRLGDGATILKLLEVSPEALDLLGADSVGFRRWPVVAGSSETIVALTAEGSDALSGAGLGQVLHRQDGGALRVGAVLSANFQFPMMPKVHGLVPVDPAPAILEPRWAPNGRMTGLSTHTVLARLQPHATVEAVARALALPLSSGEPVPANVTPLAERLTGTLRPLAWGAVVAGVLILGLCAGNVANLLLARATSRMPEFTTRLALGASHRDLARLVMVELSALVSLSVAFGLALAYLTLALTGFIIPDEYTALGMPGVTGRVAGFTSLAGITIVVAGLIPSLAVWRLTAATAQAHMPKLEGRGISALRFLMAAGQSVVAMILVAGAALFIRSFVNLTGQDTGFAPDVVILSVSYPSDLTGLNLQHVIDNTVARVRRVPGVASVGAAAGSMVDGLTSGTVYRIQGKPAVVDIKHISPGYFDAVGARVSAGRALTDTDRTAGGIVINETMATRFWPAANAVGQPVSVAGQPALTVVGVVTNSFDKALDTQPTPTVFRLFDNPDRVFFRLNYAVRTDGEPTAPLLRRAITEVERDAVVLDVSTMRDRLLESVDTRVFAMLVIGLFAVAGISVCAAGLGGIVSFLVARRTREIAIRTAIGAEPGHVRWLVMRQALAASAVGLVVGVAVGRWLSRSLESLLYGVEAGDWRTLAAGGVLLLLVVVTATWLPATRALRISPTMALKVE